MHALLSVVYLNQISPNAKIIPRGYLVDEEVFHEYSVVVETDSLVAAMPVHACTPGVND